MSSVLVVCETKDGRVKKTSREALSIGRKLAAAAGADLAAVAIGAGADAIAGETGKFGAKRLYAVSGANVDSYNTESWTGALEQIVAQAEPVVILFPATSNGRDLAPRIAARIGAGVASDVSGLEWKDGKLQARRSVYSGKVFATVEVSTPAIATCRPNAFPAEEGEPATAEVVKIEYAGAAPRARMTETKMPEAGEMSIAEADIVVSGGRGLKEATNFSYVRDLAHALGGAVGASRATVDAGWIDHQHQVGQTGRVVSPNLYIAAGISGAIQHLAGMSSSKHIIAVNKDPEAPIFRVSDLGVVGDLFTILPALTEEVKKVKAQH